MTELARNAPCPCGSGLKYKQCCLKAGRSLDLDEGGAVVTGRNNMIWAILAVGAVVALGIALLRGPALGIASFGVFGVVVGLILIFRNPPPPHKEWKDPAGM